MYTTAFPCTDCFKKRETVYVIRVYKNGVTFLLRITSTQTDRKTDR